MTTNTMATLQQAHRRELNIWLTENPEVLEAFRAGWGFDDISEFLDGALSQDTRAVAILAHELDHPAASEWLAEYERLSTGSGA